MAYDKYDGAVDLGLELDLARQATRESRKDSHEGDLRVWWVRNFPNEATHYGVTDLVEAVHLYGRLVWHDLQRDDIECNAGGLEVFRSGEWEDWAEEEELTPKTLLALRDQGRWIDSFDDVFDGLMDALRGEEV